MLVKTKVSNSYIICIPKKSKFRQFFEAYIFLTYWN